MITSTSLNPATFTPAIGMSMCGHASFEGVAAGVSPSVSIRRGRTVLTQGHVANFAGKRDYAARWGSTSWRPPHC